MFTVDITILVIRFSDFLNLVNNLIVHPLKNSWYYLRRSLYLNDSKRLTVNNENLKKNCK